MLKDKIEELIKLVECMTTSVEPAPIDVVKDKKKKKLREEDTDVS